MLKNVCFAVRGGEGHKLIYSNPQDEAKMEFPFPVEISVLAIHSQLPTGNSVMQMDCHSPLFVKSRNPFLTNTLNKVPPHQVTFMLPDGSARTAVPQL